MSLVRLYIRVLGLLGPERPLGWFLAFANVALAASQFAEPVLFGRVIDALAKAAMPLWSDLLPLLAAWVGFGIFTIMSSTLIALYADRLAHRRRHAVLTGYFEHILQLPLSYHSGTHSGRLMKLLLQGTDTLWGLWVGFFRDHFSGLVALCVFLPLSLFLNWRLALLLIVLCVVFLVLTAFVLRKTDAMQTSVEQHYSDLAERVSDALGNVALVQSYTRVEAEVSDVKAVVARLLAAQMPVLSWWAFIAVLTRTATTLTILSILLVGTWLHMQDLASIGEIVTFMNFATMLITRLQDTVNFANRVFLDAPRLREFFRVLDTVSEVRDSADAVDPGRVSGLVEFSDVSFSYGDARPAVAAVSFIARPGDTVALVGATGAGKSTALALLYRAFDPQSGTIIIDGTDIRHFTLSGLRRNIGVVFQEALLFNRSIADNLRAGKPDATEDEMRAAAERAQALDFIGRNPKGLQATVGERGRSLSGGERQRLSIARALLKDPPILILDEATSALDAGTEAKVLVAFDEVMKNRTTFVIAHRLATVRKASRILVFDAGRIVEAGSFDELVALGGRFAELARAQFMVAEPMAELPIDTAEHP